MSTYSASVFLMESAYEVLLTTRPALRASFWMPEFLCSAFVNGLLLQAVPVDICTGWPQKEPSGVLVSSEAISCNSLQPPEGGRRAASLTLDGSPLCLTARSIAFGKATLTFCALALVRTQLEFTKQSGFVAVVCVDGQLVDTVAAQQELRFDHRVDSSLDSQDV
jgi:hypothetical protein